VPNGPSRASKVSRPLVYASSSKDSGGMKFLSLSLSPTHTHLHSIASDVRMWSRRMRRKCGTETASFSSARGRERTCALLELQGNNIHVGLSVWFLLTTRARRWAPPRAAVTRWWPSTDPASSPSLQGATTARYPPGVRARGPGQEGMNGTAGLDERT